METSDCLMASCTAVNCLQCATNLRLQTRIARPNLIIVLEILYTTTRQKLLVREEVRAILAHNL